MSSIPHVSLARLAGAIVLEPTRGVEQLEASPRFAAPIAALAAGTTLTLLWYYSRLDYAWFGDYLVSTNPVLANLGRKITLARQAVLVPATISAAVNLVAAWLVVSTWLLLAARLLGRERPASQWFALASWACAPQILLLPLSLGMIWLHPDGRIAPEQLDPTTIDMIAGGLAYDNPWRAIASRIGIATLWSWTLLAIGFRRWTAAGWPTTLAIVAAPYALYYGAQLVVALLH